MPYVSNLGLGKLQFFFSDPVSFKATSGGCLHVRRLGQESKEVLVIAWKRITFIHVVSSKPFTNIVIKAYLILAIILLS